MWKQASSFWEFGFTILVLLGKTTTRFLEKWETRSISLYVTYSLSISTRTDRRPKKEISCANVRKNHYHHESVGIYGLQAKVTVEEGHHENREIFHQIDPYLLSSSYKSINAASSSSQSGFSFHK